MKMTALLFAIVMMAAAACTPQGDGGRAARAAAQAATPQIGLPVLPTATATATPTRTRTATATPASSSATPSPTGTASASPSGTPTSTSTATATAAASATSVATAAASPTAPASTATPAPEGLTAFKPVAAWCVVNGIRKDLAYHPGSRRVYMDPWLDEARKVNETQTVVCKLVTIVPGVLEALGSRVHMDPGEWEYPFPPRDPSFGYAWQADTPAPPAAP